MKTAKEMNAIAVQAKRADLECVLRVVEQEAANARFSTEVVVSSTYMTVGTIVHELKILGYNVTVLDNNKLHIDWNRR